MYSKELDELIEAVLADGNFSDKERSVVRRRAEQDGYDPDEVEIIVEGRLAKISGQLKNQSIASSVPPIPNSSPQPSTELKFRSSKYGTIRKCPNCGSLVKPGTSICSDCGIEFTETGAVNSVTKLSELLNDIEKKFSYNSSTDNEKDDGMTPRATAIVTAVSSFPVPNTREDLLELITFTESKFKHLPNSTESGVAIIKAYKAKYIECVEKAKLYFIDDPQFAEIFSKYPQNCKRRWRELTPKTRILICGLIGFILFEIIVFGLSAIV